MATPVQVSPLIKTARWLLLGAGIAYGGMHRATVAKWRAEERPIEKCAKETYFANKAAEKEEANKIFMTTSILYGFSDENPGVIVDGKVMSQEAASALRGPESCPAPAASCPTCGDE